MLALIEKQQVRKRTSRFGSESDLMVPAVRPRSVAGQRWLARREPLLEQLDKPKIRLNEIAGERDTQIVEGRPAAHGSFGRVIPAPVIAAAGMLIAVAAIVAVFLAAKPGAAALPKQGLALPSDNRIDDLLSEYGQSSADMIPELPVKLPATTILAALKTTNYTLKKGDTISEVAKNENVSVETLISFNGITDVRRLSAGMVLKIPSMNGTLYRVRKGDTLAGIAKTEDVKLSNILDANGVKSSVIVPGQELFLPGAHMSSFSYRKALGTLFIWPTVGVITSPFGMRHDPFTGIMEFHNGVDIANVQGTPVKAAMDGRVALVGRNRGYGNFIILDNGNGFQTLYGHLFKSLVQKGQYVKAGSEIGLMGDTGYATGPHLHFTIYRNSAPVNPLQYLTKR